MAFSLTDLIRDPANVVWLHIYNVNGETPSTLEAGQHLRVQIGTPRAWTTLCDETVPDGKLWQDIGFQFQAEEVDV